MRWRCSTRQATPPVHEPPPIGVHCWLQRPWRSSPPRAVALAVMHFTEAQPRAPVPLRFDVRPPGTGLLGPNFACRLTVAMLAFTRVPAAMCPASGCTRSRPARRAGWQAPAPRAARCSGRRTVAIIAFRPAACSARSASPRISCKRSRTSRSRAGRRLLERRQHHHLRRRVLRRDAGASRRRHTHGGDRSRSRRERHRPCRPAFLPDGRRFCTSATRRRRTLAASTVGSLDLAPVGAKHASGSWRRTRARSTCRAPAARATCYSGGRRSGRAAVRCPHADGQRRTGPRGRADEHGRSAMRRLPPPRGGTVAFRSNAGATGTPVWISRAGRSSEPLAPR